MMQRFHGIDRHKRSATISVLDRTGAEIKFIQSCSDLNGYIETLGPEDAVVFETGLGSFYWADKIEEKGASCYIINLPVGLTEDLDLRQQPDGAVALHPSRPPSIRPCISGGPSPALVKLCHVGKPEHEVPALLLRWARGKAPPRTVDVTVLAFVGN